MADNQASQSIIQLLHSLKSKLQSSEDLSANDEKQASSLLFRPSIKNYKQIDKRTFELLLDAGDPNDVKVRRSLYFLISSRQSPLMMNEEPLYQ